MRRLTTTAVVLSFLAAATAHAGLTFHHGPAPAKKTARVAVKADGWPDTPAAAMARHWMKAYAAGDDAMRTFYAERLSRERLAKRGMAERLTAYHELRERFGALTLASIDASMDTVVEASLLTAEHRTVPFIFTVHAKAPHALVSVAYREQRTHGH